MRRRHVLFRSILAASLFVTAAGCGTRLSHDEVVAQNRIAGATTGERAVGSNGQLDTAGSGPTGGADSGATGPGAANDPTASGGTAEPSASGTPSKSPLVVAVVGWFSGLGGASNIAMRDVVAAWAKSVNARGGIAGHPVTPLFGDDGGDESKSVALVRDFVENKGAIAILAYSSGTANGVGNYAQSKNIPMIGGASVEPIWQTNPVMFATGGGPSGRYYGVARRAKDAGIDKVATMYCTEVAACSDFNSKFVEHAHALGLNVVYQARVSLAQPDYTAECLQARNNGAQAIVPMADTNTTIRIAQSCARQDYHPKFVLALANDGLAKVPELNGALVSLTDFPWFLYSGTPALDEYGTALKTYAPHLLDGQNADFGSMGWAAGKLFEAAARNVSDNPSSQEILDGLWSLNGEPLGGLTPPLTYVRDQPTPEIFCTFQVELKDAQWVANNGVNYVCR